jgi:DNA replication protein DnaC
MQTIGAAKLRVLENQDRRDQEAQNMLESVQSYLKVNNFDDAKRSVFSLSSEYRGKGIKLFREAMPKPQETCSECGADLDFTFEDWSLRWQQHHCLKCEYNTVKNAIADKCHDIMTRRGVAKRFLSASIEDFPEKHRKQFAADTGLYLQGPRGIGKTHAMAAMIKSEILNTEPWKGKIEGRTKQLCYTEPLPSTYPLFISVPELLLELRGTFNHSLSDTSEQELLNIYSSVKVLYLDDIGTEKATDWAISTLYLLINRRYEDELRTIISSNLSLDELADHLDDRISSRIAGMCEVVKMTGEDRRLK